MMQVPTTAQPQALAPSYNAVKIDIHNPQVNTPGCNTNPQQNSVPGYYDVPKQSVYEVPSQSIYKPAQAAEPKATPEQPSVPAPVIVPTTTSTVAAQAPVPPAPQAPVAPEAAPQKVEVKAPQNAPSSSVDLNGFLAKLNGTDLGAQEKALEDMATLAQGNPEQAKDLLDTKIMDSLVKVVQADTSKLEGPSAKQLEIKDKIMKNQPVTDAEKAEAGNVSPKEQAELNKKYAMYTTAILQKLYGNSVEKMNNTVVPMTDLPGAAVVVEQVKSNQNPVVRAAGIDALSYIQRPEYKKDLGTIFALAQKDKDADVQKSAKEALDKLAQVPDATPAPVAPTAQAPAQTPAPAADAKVAQAPADKQPQEAVAEAPVAKEAPAPEKKAA